MTLWWADGSRGSFKMRWCSCLMSLNCCQQLPASESLQTDSMQSCSPSHIIIIIIIPPPPIANPRSRFGPPILSLSFKANSLIARASLMPIRLRSFVRFPAITHFTTRTGRGEPHFDHICFKIRRDCLFYPWVLCKMRFKWAGTWTALCSSHLNRRSIGHPSNWAWRDWRQVWRWFMCRSRHQFAVLKWWQSIHKHRILQTYLHNFRSPLWMSVMTTQG